jgi:hypothetical protein
MVPSLLQYAAGLSPALRTAIGFLARHHLAPEAYLYGWVDVLLLSVTRGTYIFGRVFGSGQWFFFPAIFLIKTTLTLLLLLVSFCFVRIRRHGREFLFLTVPSCFYFVMSISSMVNLGVRHILPVYPFCIIAAAAAAALLFNRSMIGRVAVTGLFLLTVVSSLHAFPNLLAYSNEVAGGPSHTYKLVSNANADWGQGLKWAKVYLDKHPSPDCWADFYGPFLNPSYYGIKCKPLLSGMGHQAGIGPQAMPSTISGTVLVSATEIGGIYWGPDNLNPYLAFRNQKPDDTIENIILVYRGTFDVPLLAAQTNAMAASNLLVRQHRAAEAVVLAQTAVKQAPDSAEVTAILGQALMSAGRTAEGKEALEMAAHLAENNHPEYQKALIAQLRRGLSGS